MRVAEVDAGLILLKCAQFMGSTCTQTGLGTLNFAGSQLKCLGLVRANVGNCGLCAKSC